MIGTINTNNCFNTIQGIQEVFVHALRYLFMIPTVYCLMIDLAILTISARNRFAKQQYMIKFVEELMTRSK